MVLKFIERKRQSVETNKLHQIWTTKTERTADDRIEAEFICNFETILFRDVSSNLFMITVLGLLHFVVPLSIISASFPKEEEEEVSLNTFIFCLDDMLAYPVVHFKSTNYRAQKINEE
ncbi:CLUMA_CG004481, isoform A [Clunio marinus]|uniref:CLUMA_CG004481, isoform A n=1 Tax=Clunio marinus TaxID=568069 RepID=A0A1J1HRZ3_9DIPT|nr:CLUMA_CG004481, isoform A [Clunio marinus]